MDAGKRIRYTLVLISLALAANAFAIVTGLADEFYAHLMPAANTATLIV